MSLNLLKQVSTKILCMDWSLETEDYSIQGKGSIEFLHLPCTPFQLARDLRRVAQLFLDGKSKEFAVICREFDIPSHNLFLYFQLRYTAFSQFPGLVMEISDFPLKKLLRTPGSVKLLSTYYAILLQAFVGYGLLTRHKWGAWLWSLTGGLGGSGGVVDIYSDILQR